MNTYIPGIYGYGSRKLGKKITGLWSGMWKHGIPAWRDGGKVIFPSILIVFSATTTASQPLKKPKANITIGKGRDRGKKLKKVIIIKSERNSGMISYPF